jgi:hypothetical protein
MANKKFVYFGRRAKSTDDTVYNLLEQGGFETGYQTTEGFKNEMRRAAIDAGLKKAVNGLPIKMSFVTEEAFEAIKDKVDPIVVFKLDEVGAARDAVNASYPNSMDKVTFKAYKADVRKAYASTAHIVTGADQTQAADTFVNPYSVGDIVKEHEWGGSVTHYRVSRVTAKSYTIVPYKLRGYGDVYCPKFAKANYNNVDVVMDHIITEFSIPYKGNESEFVLDKPQAKVMRIGKDAFGRRSNMLAKVAESDLEYYEYHDSGR